MNVEIGTETQIFLFWEYLFQNFGIMSLQYTVTDIDQDPPTNIDKDPHTDTDWDPPTNTDKDSHTDTNYWLRSIQ